MKDSAIKRAEPVVAWAMYDFANSAFATSFLSVIFSVYFCQILVPPEGIRWGGMAIPGESVWGYLISGVMATVLLLAPALGTIADHRSERRLFLVSWAVVGIICTFLLLGAVPGRLLFATIITFVAILGYEMSLIFYNAFLNDLSDESTAGRVSGLGFALGYLGGGLCLALNLWMLKSPATFGLDTGDSTLPVRASVFVVGLWWFIFSLPMFFAVKDKPVPKNKVLDGACARQVLGHAFGQLRETLKAARRQPSLFRFIIAYLVYDDGIQTLLLMASIMGAKILGMSAGELAMCYLMIQFVAFWGALIFGRLADAWGHKQVILLSLAVYALVILWATFMTQSWEFWTLGAVAGLVIGGSQAASRSLYSLMIPRIQAAEFFSLFSVVGKAAAVMGPFLFGLIAQFVGLRPAVASILVFFVVGGLILRPLQEKDRIPPLL